LVCSEETVSLLVATAASEKGTRQIVGLKYEDYPDTITGE
jgi:hypothetical protein